MRSVLSFEIQRNIIHIKEYTETFLNSKAFTLTADFQLDVKMEL